MNDKNVEPFIVYTFVYTKYTSWSCHTSKPHRNKFSKFVVCSFLLIIFSSLEFTSACLLLSFRNSQAISFAKRMRQFQTFSFCSILFIVAQNHTHPIHTIQYTHVTQSFIISTFAKQKFAADWNPTSFSSHFHLFSCWWHASRMWAKLIHKRMVFGEEQLKLYTKKTFIKCFHG